MDCRLGTGFRSACVVALFLTHLFPALSFEPEDGDLDCLNDYDTTMYCYLRTKEAINCLQYSLNIKLSSLPRQVFGSNCTFSEMESTSQCECKLEIPGFVVEIYTASLLIGQNLIYTKDFSTQKSIKPKTPFISSVIQTDNGNFLVTWRNNYPNDTVFFGSLKTELSYRIKGQTHKESRMVSASTSEELVGSNMQPSTKYVLTARTYTDYNSHFSDASEEYEFTTPASRQSILTIIATCLCMVVIILICLLFFCFWKLKRKWWDQISAPSKIHLVHEPKVSVLTLQNETPSSVQVESPLKVDPEEKRCDEYNGHTAGTVSSSSDYPDICRDVGEQSHSQHLETLEEALEKVLRHHVDLDRDLGNVSRPSCFNNDTYLITPKNVSRLDMISDYKALDHIVIQKPLTPQLTDPHTYSTDYQSFIEVSSKKNRLETDFSQAQAIVNSDDADQCILDKLMCSLNAFQPSLERCPLQCDDEYRPL